MKMQRVGILGKKHLGHEAATIPMPNGWEYWCLDCGSIVARSNLSVEATEALMYGWTEIESYPICQCGRPCWARLCLCGRDQERFQEV